MKRNKRNRRIGLTGGICSGKSTVSGRLLEKGAYIIDADVISREALEPETECFSDTVKAFGKEILTEEGRIDRKLLANIIFSDEEKKLKLNSIIHPFVISEMVRIADQNESISPEQLIVFDVPLLFTCGFYRDLDQNVVVAADEEIRIKRIMARNKLTEQEARARIVAQMPQDEQIRLADYVIWNNGTREELFRKVDELYHILTAGMKK